MKGNSSLRSLFSGNKRGPQASRSQDNREPALVESKTTVLKRRVANARAAAADATARVSGRESSITRETVQYTQLQQQAVTDDEGAVSGQDGGETTEDENVLFLNKNATSPQRSTASAEMRAPVAPPRTSQARLKPTKTVLATSLVTSNSTMSGNQQQQAFRLNPLSGSSTDPNSANYGSTSPAVLPVTHTSRLLYDESEFMPRARLLKNKNKPLSALPRESRRCRWFVKLLWIISVIGGVFTGLYVLLGPMYYAHDLTLAHLREMLGIRFGGCNLMSHAADLNHSLLETLPLMPFVQHIDLTAGSNSDADGFVGVSLLAYNWHNKAQYTPVLISQQQFTPLPYVSIEPHPDDGTHAAAAAAASARASGADNSGGAVITYQCLDDDVLSSRRACLMLTDAGWIVKLDAISGKKIWQHQLKSIVKSTSQQRCRAGHFNVWVKDDLDQDSFSDYVLCIKITCDAVANGPSSAPSSHYVVAFMTASDGVEIGSFTPGEVVTEDKSRRKRQISTFSAGTKFKMSSPVTLFTQKNDVEYCAFVAQVTMPDTNTQREFLFSIPLQTLFLHYEKLTLDLLTPLVALPSSSQLNSQPIQAIFNVVAPIQYISTDNNTTTVGSGKQNFLLVSDNYVGYANTTKGDFDWVILYQNISNTSPKTFQYADIISSMNVLAIQVCPRECSTDPSAQCSVAMIDILNGHILFQLATDCRRPSMNEREILLVNVASQRQAPTILDDSAISSSSAPAAAAPVSVPKKQYNRKDHGKGKQPAKPAKAALRILPGEPHKAHHGKMPHGVENKNDENNRNRRYVLEDELSGKYKRDYDFSNNMPTYTQQNRFNPHRFNNQKNRSPDLVLDLNDEDLAREVHGHFGQAAAPEHSFSSQHGRPHGIFPPTVTDPQYNDMQINPPFPLTMNSAMQPQQPARASPPLLPPPMTAPLRVHHDDISNVHQNNHDFLNDNHISSPVQQHTRINDNDNHWPAWKPLVMNPPVKPPAAAPMPKVVAAAAANAVVPAAMPPPAAPLLPNKSFLDLPLPSPRHADQHHQNPLFPSRHIPPLPDRAKPIPPSNPAIPSISAAMAVKAAPQQLDPSTDTTTTTTTTTQSSASSVTVVDPSSVLLLSNKNPNSDRNLTVEDAVFTEIPPLVLVTTAASTEAVEEDDSSITLEPPEIELALTTVSPDTKPSASLVQRVTKLFGRIGRWFKSLLFKLPKEDDETLKTSRILSDTESNIDTRVPAEVKFLPLNLFEQASVPATITKPVATKASLSFRQRELINAAAGGARPNISDAEADRFELREVFKSLEKDMQSVDVLFIKRHRNGTLSPYTITLTDEIKVIDPEQIPACADLYNVSSAQVPRALCRNERDASGGGMPRHLYALIQRSRGMPVVLSKTNSFDSQVLIVSKVSLIELLPSAPPQQNSDKISPAKAAAAALRSRHHHQVDAKKKHHRHRRHDGSEVDSDDSGSNIAPKNNIHDKHLAAKSQAFVELIPEQYYRVGPDWATLYEVFTINNSFYC